MDRPGYSRLTEYVNSPRLSFVLGRREKEVVACQRLRTPRPSSCRRACAGSSDRGRCHPVPVGWTGTLWANARTYLPVRLSSHGNDFSFLIDFRWLAPTKANLAELHQTVPAGFRRV